MPPLERSLPLFPLNTVLFPNATIPLHVFEERYRLMVQVCLDADSMFGIVLIKSGSEVGEPAEPHTVGTVANIEDVKRMDAGRMLLRVNGAERFAIQRITQEKPYIEADVQLLHNEDDEEPVAQDVLDMIRAAATRHVRLAMGLRGGWVREAKTPEDPAALSYFVGTLLQSEPGVKQVLLEEHSTARRLQRELALMEQEEEALKALVAKRLSRRSFGGG
jgi:Lon protease-like protein